MVMLFSRIGMLFVVLGFLLVTGDWKTELNLQTYTYWWVGIGLLLTGVLLGIPRLVRE